MSFRRWNGRVPVIKNEIASVASLPRDDVIYIVSILCFSNAMIRFRIVNDTA